MNIYKNGGVELDYIKEFDSKPYACCHMCTVPKESIFYELDLKKEFSYNRKLQDETVLVYLQKGELLINYGVGKSARLSSNHLFLLPKNLQAVCVPSHDARAIACVLNGTDLKVCDSYSQGMLEKQMETLSDTLHRNKFLCSLICEDLLVQFFKTLTKAFSRGIACLHFQHIKRQELFLYLHMCYSLEELVYFFYPIMNYDNDFQEFVMANYHDIRDVKELAEKANMSVSTFSRKFKDTFNDTAQHWLLARRAEAVLYDIVRTNDTFTEIAERHSFSSPAYLSNFCKQRFGKTPATLRKHWGLHTDVKDIVDLL